MFYLKSNRHTTSLEPPQRTRHSPGRLDWRFHWAWSRRDCPLESDWWTWSQTGWHHQPISDKIWGSVKHLCRDRSHWTMLCYRWTHQERFKWRLYFACEEVLPIYMPEECVGLGERTTTAKSLCHDHHLLFQAELPIFWFSVVISTHTHEGCMINSNKMFWFRPLRDNESAAAGVQEKSTTGHLKSN